jgi:coenzyme F420-0:L-glutamate ligase/coenzyme F420-1:gamma-L-glutamate ligase
MAMGMGQLTLVAVPGIPLIGKGDDLVAILLDALRAAAIELADGDIVVVAQKLISKAEGRTVALSTVEPSAAAIELAAATEKEPAIAQLIIDESRRILRSRPGVIIAEHKLGFVLANAGIDRSNVEADADVVLLLPENSDQSAAELRAGLSAALGIQLGVIIADSVGRAWRMGTTGMTLGCAGVEALANLRGRHDMFGRELQVSEHAIADSVASAAELIMGEADEATPVVIVRGLDQGTATQNSQVLLRPNDEDMFR